MKHKTIWIRGGLAVVLVWALAFAAIAITRSLRMTATDVMGYVADHPLANQSPAQRQETIDGLAQRVNRLSIEERQKFRYDDHLHNWVESMTDAERDRYLDLTLPRGLQQMMTAFNEMRPAQRQRLVDRALADLERIRADTDDRDLQAGLSNDQFQRMVDEGMKSFLSDASAATKIDLQPVIEQMQIILQQGHR